MSQIWREVSQRSVPQKSRGAVDGVAKRFAGAEDSRAFRSSSGSEAILLSKNAVTDSPDLSLELDKRARDYNFVAVVAQAGASEDVGGLLKYCDVIALPEAVADKAPKGLVSCGQLAYRKAPDEIAAFTLFCNQPADSEFLTRDAPLDIGEPDDNLDSRERWFRKRHDPKR